MVMYKIGVDNFSFHRYFGWIIPGQTDPGIRWTHEKFLDRAASLNLNTVSMETCFMEELSSRYLERLRKECESRSLEGMLSWGHPRGLETGKNPGATEDLKRTIALAGDFGNPVIRIVGGGWVDRAEEPIRVQIERTIEVLKEVSDVAASRGVVLAMENHMDFTADEQLEILRRIGSDHLKVLLDTGNNLRILEDPIEVVRKLAPYAVATHIKDIAATGKGNPAINWQTFWPTVPLGQGILDLSGMIDILRQNGYTGALNLEIDLLDPRWPDDDLAVAESIAHLRKIAS